MDKLDSENQHHSNLRQNIETQIRRAILQGILKPGDKIIESKISSQLGVSRSPIREVLSALEQEGLVISRPRHGYSVVDFLEKDIDEIYSLRTLLEKTAIRRALPLIQDQDILAMQEIVDRMNKSAGLAEETYIMAETDMSFHETFLILAGHSRLYTAWKAIQSQTMILMSITTQTHIRQQKTPFQIHQEFLWQIQKKRVEQIEKTLVEHIEDGKQRALYAIQSMHQIRNDETSEASLIGK